MKFQLRNVQMESLIFVWLVASNNLFPLCFVSNIISKWSVEPPKGFFPFIFFVLLKIIWWLFEGCSNASIRGRTKQLQNPTQQVSRTQKKDYYSTAAKGTNETTKQTDERTNERTNEQTMCLLFRKTRDWMLTPERTRKDFRENTKINPDLK